MSDNTDCSNIHEIYEKIVIIYVVYENKMFFAINLNPIVNCQICQEAFKLKNRK